MAGSRHHEVPQFLMRGFASRIIPKRKRDTVLVWKYQKNAEPVEASTVDVGVEKKFYSDEADSVDDEITELEKTFSRSVNQARELEDGSKISDQTLLEFIANLTMRTKHLRDAVIDIGEFAVDGILGHFSDYGNMRAYYIKLLTHRRDILMNALEKHLNEATNSEFEKALVRTVIEHAPVEAFIQLIDSQGPKMAEQVKAVQQQIAEGLHQMVKEAHIKHLLKELVSVPRVEYFQQLHWYVRKPTEPITLGDVCCLFRISDGRYVSIGGPADEIERVIVPLAHNCVVVGTPENQVPHVSVSEINEASAKVSRNYFVSSVFSPEMVQLATLLDTEADLLSESEMEQFLDEAISESLTKEQSQKTK